MQLDRGLVKRPVSPRTSDAGPSVSDVLQSLLSFQIQKVPGFDGGLMHGFSECLPISRFLVYVLMKISFVKQSWGRLGLFLCSFAHLLWRY